MSPLAPPVFDPWQTAWAAADALAVSHAPAAQWRQRQVMRLAQLLRAAQASPLLGAPVRASGPPEAPPLARLARLAPTHKRALMARFDDWVTDPALRLAGLHDFARRPAPGDAYLGRYVVWESSGSSGEPALFVQDARALAALDALECTRGPLALAGAWPGAARIAYVGAIDGPFAGIVSFERARRLNPWFGAVSRAFSFMQPLPTLLDALNAFAPTVLATYPSMAWVLAEAQAAGRLAIAPRALWTGGETLTAGLRRSIAGRFHAPVRNNYGASECLTLASECRCGGLHLNADWAILEPVDGQGRPVPDGEPGATTLLTNLANHVQPILRYDLGDRVRFVPGACACGSTLPLIEVEGRCDDVMTLDDERGHATHLAPLALTTVLEDDAGVFDFRLRRSGPRALELDLRDRAACAPAAAALRAYLRRQGLGTVRLRTHAGALPAARGRSGKQQRVVCAPP